MGLPVVVAMAPPDELSDPDAGTAPSYPYATDVSREDAHGLAATERDPATAVEKSETLPVPVPATEEAQLGELDETDQRVVVQTPTVAPPARC